MYRYNCLNPIAAVGLDMFSEDYKKVIVSTKMDPVDFEGKYF